MSLHDLGAISMMSSDSQAMVARWSDPQDMEHRPIKNKVQRGALRKMKELEAR